MEATAASKQSSIMPRKQNRHYGWLQTIDGALRRLIDITAAAAGLVLLAPVFAIIAILIKRDAPGPIFYWGTRMGRRARPFRILKFRTMYERPESYDGPKITGSGDSRITSIGQWLRDTKLNELPQLWNVLIGEMSLVGPRPEDPDLVKTWPEEIRAELLAVRPGITSPASVMYRDEEEMLGRDTLLNDYLRDILPSKLRLDLLYVRHRSILTDLDVIFWTTVTLLPQVKRKRIPEHSLFWGPLSRFLSRYFSWFLLDLIVALLAVSAAGVIWHSGQSLHLGMVPALLLALGMALVFSVLNMLLKLDRVYWSKAPAEAVFDLAVSCTLATLGLILANLAFNLSVVIPTGVLLNSGLLAFLGFVAVRYRWRIVTGLATRWLRLRPNAGMGERVLIVGAGEASDVATWLLRHRDVAEAFTLVGVVDDAPRKQHTRVNGLPVLGSTGDLPQLVADYDIGIVVFAIVDIDPLDRQRILSLCGQTAVRMVMIPSLLETIWSHLSVEKAEVVPETTLTAQQLAGWLTDMDHHVNQQSWEAAQLQVAQLRHRLGMVTVKERPAHRQQGAAHHEQ